MSKYAEIDFCSLCLSGASPQARGQPSFKPREHTFDLRPLAILLFVKAAIHFASILRLGPASSAALIQVDDGATDSEFLPRKCVVAFRIVAGICEQTVNLHALAGARQNALQQGAS